MKVRYFPFDEQTCWLKFGSWTFDGFQVENISKQNPGRKHFQAKNSRRINISQQKSPGKKAGSSKGKMGMVSKCLIQSIKGHFLEMAAVTQFPPKWPNCL